jgi:hypothetical protein
VFLASAVGAIKKLTLKQVLCCCGKVLFLDITSADICCLQIGPLTIKQALKIL